MSQVYSTEPAPTGRVVLDTTHGPIDINLFCKECPTTTRSFLQLCLDGYYDGVIFHRILPDFLIQTGLTASASVENAVDPKRMDSYLRGSSAVPSSASGTGDVLGWERKKLELSHRIRFNHRGQVAAAFPLKAADDGSDNHDESLMLRYQFFITLDESPFLDGNHVIFGTIAGPTIFNALRISKTEVDDTTGCPVDMTDAPPRIKGVKVDYHPFQDLVATSERLVPWKIDAKRAGSDGKVQSEIEKRRKKRKGKRDFNVLSFGDEERDYEAIVSQTSDGKSKNGGAIQSSHDVLAHESTFLSSSVDAHLEKLVQEKEEKSVEEKRDGKSNGETVNETKNKITFKDPEFHHSVEESSSSSSKPSNERIEKTSNDSTIKQREPASATMKQSETAEMSTREKPNHSNKAKSIGAVEARRAKYLKNGHSLASKKERLKREDDTMAKLMAFRNKVLETKSGSRQNDEKSQNGTDDRVADDSLASRMAKRLKQAQDEEARLQKEKEGMISMPGYHGQVDEGGSDASDNDAANSKDWMGTKFKCKRHIDLDSRMSALDKAGDVNNQDGAVGGDGRRMDDYLVVDEKKQGGKGHGHHHGRHRGSHVNNRHGDNRRRDDYHRMK
ncbi:hypothetical protein HJC23_008497 [Cyclotella cryptica]|uniref:PPIase cyclophilin-type domain-containing protein n=1 Tax=Cyclotella cryptica TaxID=29204 RepID=A0ABD3QX96_9STRA|eukprot:CCRYP_001247-RA/>CCRYP_001247-RA protein AED:0.02 eAED:-0.02 QI:0/-1/0/1/-1/1/1/0/614